MFEIIIEAVMNFCLSNSIDKSGYNLSRNIRRVFFNMSLFLKKSYKQHDYFCYVHRGLRFTTYV